MTIIGRWLDRRRREAEARAEHERRLTECLALSGATREQIIRHLSGVLYDLDTLIEGLKLGLAEIERDPHAPPHVAGEAADRGKEASS